MADKITIAEKVTNNPPQRLLKKNPENKIYLICIAGKDGENDSWELVQGRTEAYETIKNDIDFIDLEHSFILVESAKLENRLSIVAFMRHVEGYYQDSFDIDDYIKGDWDESDYKENNFIENQLTNAINNADRLSMADMINNLVDIQE